ncbi:MAG: thioredoxin domain-containing protein [Steroidobacteraceae bacterium]
MPHAAPPPMPGNHLGSSTSPYLLQHAGNPVEWYTWGDAAFDAARSSGKPVLLSIGYSACHWCHVMAHESFEDPATAAVMNALFINIKVDREERPDIDRIYQLAHQLLTRRSGGWPLTMFLTHDDQRPFFGGTYFPPTARGGMPGFSTVLARVAEYYRDQRAALRAQSAALVAALGSLDAPAAGPAQRLDDAPLLLLRQQLEQRFDREHGGFTPAPKFPHAGMISRLLRDWHATSLSEQPDLNALFMATLTLKRMADGGVYDQLGGGFYRYSVDQRWEIPHFEKMLYDNGMLLSVYAEAAMATGDTAFSRVVRGTADFLLQELRGDNGAFCSSFDADSEGHEGRYYVWDPQQVAAVLEAPDAALFGARYGLDRRANFEGSWHLLAARELADLAGTADQDSMDAIAQRLDAAREQLLAARRRRVAPVRDDKILTGWNALAIRGLADAARALGDPRLAEAGAVALAYLWQHHWRDGRLLAVSRSGRAQLGAYLDDHASLIDAILALATVRFDAGALQFAAQLADCLLAHFEDSAHGGFYFTASDHEVLIHRSRSFSDDATPSGNATAVAALQKLGWLLGEPRYLDAAERALRAAWVQLTDTPLALVHMATALEEHLQPHSFVILRGEAAEIGRWQRRLQAVWRPLVSVIAIPADAAGLPAAFKEKPPRGAAVAYLCRGSTCESPLTTLVAVEAALQRAPEG